MKETNWNQNWHFWEDHNSFALIWDIPETAKKIDLPHDAMIEKPADPETLNGGNTGYRDGGSYVYVKNLFVEKSDKDQIFQLKFEGAYMNAFVYVNGQLAAKRPYGYSSFYVTLNDFLNYGSDNEIRVQIKNGAMPNSRWYSGSGLIRDVYLLTSSNKIFLKPDNLKIKVESANNEQSTIFLSQLVINKEINSVEDLHLQIEVYDNADQKIINEDIPFSLLADEERKIEERITISNPNLWSEDNPYLYRVEVNLISKNDQQIDHTNTLFGVREVRIDANYGLRINGVKTKLRGACIHHDSGLLGAAAYDDAQFRQVRILKEAGFNAIRMSHIPAAPALLRACDKVGMYVMDESFDMWNRSKSDYDYSLYFEEWWQQDIISMVEKDFNHPSVILYSIGNEIPEIATNQGLSISNKINQLIHSLDPTRYTLAGVNGLFSVGNQLISIVNEVVEQQSNQGSEQGNVNDFMTAMNKYLDQIIVNPNISKKLAQVFASTDIAGYNYMTARYEQDLKDYPQRIIVGTETYPPEIARNWNLVEKYDRIIGDFTWTGWDYIGETGVGIPGYKFGEGGFGAQYPAQLAYVGDIDITGFRRPLSYYREIVFGIRKDPYIAVQNPHHYGEELNKTPWMMSDTISSWTWNISEGSPVKVEVYSPGSTVELKLNDQVVEKKEVNENHRVIFDLTYIPGELTAISYDKDQEVGRTSIVTANTEQKQIKLEMDPISYNLEKENNSNRQLYYLKISLCDLSGNVINDRDEKINVEILDNNGKILGFGSGNPKPDNNYLELSTATFNGRALAIIQKNDEDQKVEIKVTNGSTLNAKISL
ncbi:glycoside hydrolase family 2 TIM barrel-domain containing protein [Xylocopilactobacillus apis]|uniref:Beta-galactosidase n=1 Tax=Xylocopilactobacillus apis TaxID=2932183 RepID=A0AAU9DSH4_9LACO|nr:glycoside hydrolase family 2 TIM barrel-domain containing protein [Xylocopilactobacillus apis]BDR56628.1 beta-galactosidase [Xylocopilactobacillus apis]